ncbi:MAG: chromate transporter [Bryobacterales bacterium]|nr:chromate transporter [Bryobacterales bacterium]
MHASRRAPIPPQYPTASGDAPPPSLQSLVALVARVVNGTFGGGSTILGVFQREMVERKRWLTDDQYGLCFAVARITPGTSILAFCAAAGWFLGRWRAAILTLLAAVVPCAAIAIGMLFVYEQLKTVTWFAVALRGAMAAAIGVMLAAGWSIMAPYWKSSSRLRHIAVLLASLALMLGVHFSPLSILGIAALAGVLFPEPVGDLRQ